MMTHYREPATALDGSGDDVLVRAVVTNHVEIGGGHGVEVRSEVASNGNGFQKYLGQQHGGPDVQPHTARITSRCGAEIRDHVADQTKIMHRRLPQSAAVGPCGDVNRIGTQRDVDARGNVGLASCGEDTLIPVRRFFIQNKLSDGCTQSDLVTLRSGGGLVEKRHRLCDHSERAVVDGVGHFLAGLAQRRELDVVDCASAVASDGFDHPSANQVDQNGAASDFDDVCPESHDDRAVRSDSRRNGADDTPKC